MRRNPTISRFRPLPSTTPREEIAALAPRPGASSPVIQGEQWPRGDCGAPRPERRGQHGARGPRRGCDHPTRRDCRARPPCRSPDADRPRHRRGPPLGGRHGPGPSRGSPESARRAAREARRGGEHPDQQPGRTCLAQVQRRAPAVPVRPALLARALRRLALGPAGHRSADSRGVRRRGERLALSGLRPHPRRPGGVWRCPGRRANRGGATAGRLARAGRGARGTLFGRRGSMGPPAPVHGCLRRSSAGEASLRLPAQREHAGGRACSGATGGGAEAPVDGELPGLSRRDLWRSAPRSATIETGPVT